MQISVETMTGLERRLTISVPSETFEGQITARLGKAANEVRLPGFRPGKVPMKEVRRRYGQAVRAEVAGELMQSSFVEAVQEEALTPAGSPNLEVVKMAPGGDFEFTATFEVFPNVEVTDLSKVEIKKPEAEITAADIDDMTERLRDQRKIWEPVERGAEDDDQVTLDFTGYLDGETFEGGSGEDLKFIVGGGQMIKDFDAGVRGQSAGSETEFDAVFPEDYRAENLQGKTATFKINIKAVEQAKLPELDEEFFTAFGIEEGGLEAFRDDILENMQREMDAAARNQIKTQVMDRLGDLHETQLPQALVHREIHILKDQMLQQMRSYGSGEDEPNLPDDFFKPQAEKRVMVGLIVNRIVETATLTADPDTVRERIEVLAQPYAEPQQVINYYYSNAEQLQQIEMAVLEDKVVDHVVAQAVVEIVQTNYADIIAGTAIQTDAAKDAESPDAVSPDSESENSD
ncbi:MAG: trigger factor [Gammaproteobacteria bacterium]|nr:trigger factor [Gammaproteobacteria bacterium]